MQISTAHLSQILRQTHGGPLGEYVPLMAALSLAAVISVVAVGEEVRDIFETVETEIASAADQTPGGPGAPGGLFTPGGPGGAAPPNSGPYTGPGNVVDVSFGTLVDGQWCPPSGYGWAWDVDDGVWRMPGVALWQPSGNGLASYPTFAGRDEHSSAVIVPTPTSYNYWGQYDGLYILGPLHEWRFSGVLDYSWFQQPPALDGRCPTMMVIDPGYTYVPDIPAGYTQVARVEIVPEVFNSTLNGWIGPSYPSSETGIIMAEDPLGLFRAAFTQTTSQTIEVRTWGSATYSGTSMTCNGGALMPYLDNPASDAHRWDASSAMPGGFVAGQRYNCHVVEPE